MCFSKVLQSFLVEKNVSFPELRAKYNARVKLDRMIQKQLFHGYLINTLILFYCQYLIDD